MHTGENFRAQKNPTKGPAGFRAVIYASQRIEQDNQPKFNRIYKADQPGKTIQNDREIKPDIRGAIQRGHGPRETRRSSREIAIRNRNIIH